MGNTLTLAYNKIKYEISKQLSDPDADAYAKQQEAQASQDKAAADRDAAAKTVLDQAAADQKAASDKAAALEARSKFSPIKEQLRNISTTILSNSINLIILGLALFGGKIAANQAIGYNIPFRILSFFYGMLFFFIVLPKAYFMKYLYDVKVPDYTFLPLKVYVPNGWAERIFIGSFCYEEDTDSKIAENLVVKQYTDGFNNSLKTAAAVAGAAAAVSGAVVTMVNSSTSSKPAAAIPSQLPPISKPIGPTPLPPPSVVAPHHGTKI